MWGSKEQSYLSHCDVVFLKEKIRFFFPFHFRPSLLLLALLLTSFIMLSVWMLTLAHLKLL